jgi:hypothetical protein
VIDRKTYHVSGELSQAVVSAELTDAQLPDLFNQFAARQILHVTFGSVLDTFGSDLQQILRTNLKAYQTYIQKHFDRHLAAFQTSHRV